MRGIRVNEDGDASLEDLTNSAAQGTSDFDPAVDPEGSKSSNKKVSMIRLLFTFWRGFDL